MQKHPKKNQKENPVYHPNHPQPCYDCKKREELLNKLEAELKNLKTTKSFQGTKSQNQILLEQILIVLQEILIELKKDKTKFIPIPNPRPFIPDPHPRPNPWHPPNKPRWSHPQTPVEEF